MFIRFSSRTWYSSILNFGQPAIQEQPSRACCRLCAQAKQQDQPFVARSKTVKHQPDTALSCSKLLLTYISTKGLSENNNASTYYLSNIFTNNGICTRWSTNGGRGAAQSSLTDLLPKDSVKVKTRRKSDAILERLKRFYFINGRGAQSSPSYKQSEFSNTLQGWGLRRILQIK